MQTFTVNIECSPVALFATLGLRPPAVSKGDEHAGLVTLPRERLLEAYKTLKTKLEVLPESESFTVELTDDERVALFYEVVAKRVTVTYTALEITEFNFPVLTGLILSGFTFPQQDDFYL